MPIVYPATYTEAKREVNARRLVGHKTVVLTAKTMNRRQVSTTLDVQGPPEGQGALLVHVYSGMTRVHVIGGVVSVTLDSVWGNVVQVDPAAAATTRVTVGHGRKATVEGLPIEQIDGDPSRLFWSLKYADRDLPPQEAPADDEPEVVDLLAALQRSIDRHRTARGSGA